MCGNGWIICTSGHTWISGYIFWPCGLTSIRNYSPFDTFGKEAGQDRKERGSKENRENKEYQAESRPRWNWATVRLPGNTIASSLSPSQTENSSTEPRRSSRLRAALFAIGSLFFLLDTLCQSSVERCNRNSSNVIGRIMYLNFFAFLVRISALDIHTQLFHIASGMRAENVDSCHA
jgi:hypothetical protein